MQNNEKDKRKIVGILMTLKVLKQTQNSKKKKQQRIVDDVRKPIKFMHKKERGSGSGEGKHKKLKFNWNPKIRK